MEETDGDNKRVKSRTAEDEDRRRVGKCQDLSPTTWRAAGVRSRVDLTARGGSLAPGSRRMSLPRFRRSVAKPGFPQRGAGSRITSPLRLSFTASAVIGIRFDTVDAHLNQMGEKIDRLSTHLDDAECQLPEVEDGSAEVLKHPERVEWLLRGAADKKDLEAQSHRNNIRITGIAETSNMERPDTFVEKDKTNFFRCSTFKDTFTVEHIHRSLGPHPRVSGLLRLIVMPLLRFRNKDTTLQLPREQANLQYQGSVISIFLYFTVAVQDARCKLADAKLSFINMA
ncbi:hypothetical protein NDU88_011787 [Pleurodeles waltl]|uniref:Uncharacterized protein n=1 Tax=Pleurodeles waltl TaxID=8319 RepID=A0AAV7S3C2_PLEWA|nr:hypothetical protein NDU88_011787 [Pleurodeles waltl]